MGFFLKAKNRSFSNFSILVQKNSKTFLFAFCQNTLKIEFLYLLNNNNKKTFLDLDNSAIFS